MKAIAAASSYWRLSTFYFLYFACLGVLMPYWSLYLAAVGLSGTAIGMVTATGFAIRIVAPNIWGWLGDRSGRRLLLIRLAAVVSTLCFTTLLWRQDFAWVLAIITVHAFFWNAILSQFEVVAIITLRERYQLYGLVRLWGSVSFILAVLAAGVLFDHLDVRHLPWPMLALFLCVIAGSLLVPEVPRSEGRAAHPGGIAALLRERVFLAFLAAAFLMQAAHGPYYTYFSLYLDGMGFSRAAIGLLWSLGVLCEIAVFAFAHRLHARFNLRQLLLVSALLGGVRWLAIAFAGDGLVALGIAQTLHAATFGTFHAASIEVVRRHFGIAHQGQGQASFTAVAYGLGGAIGAVVSGYLWEHDPRLGFVLAGVSALLGGAIIHVAVRGPLVQSPP